MLPSEITAGPDARTSTVVKFFEQIASESLLQLALNQLHGIRVVIKDLDARIVWASDNVVARCGYSSVREMTGLSDFDINPPDLASAYSVDDQRVLRTGESLLGKAELSFNDAGLLEWVQVNKIPLKDREQTTIGLLATIQPHPNPGQLPSHDNDLNHVINHIQKHLDAPLRAAELAAMVRLSKRQLERRFRRYTGFSPKEFVVRCRIQEACRQLDESDSTVCAISNAVGFCDQSAFTKAFRQLMETTPGQYRRERRAPTRSTCF